jgi:lysophospholipase L1-like esterase
VGDSITYGMNLPGRETNSYPARLQAMLGAAWDVRNFGVSGRTMLKAPVHPYCATYWKEAAFADATAFNPDVVVLKLGTNDFSLDENWALRRQFVLDYLAMLDHFAAVPARPRIFLVQPAPLFDEAKPFIGPNRAQIRTLIRQIGEERNLAVIDLDPAMGGRRDLFLDGCHPNVEGAAIIAREVFRSVAGTPAPGR